MTKDAPVPHDPHTPVLRRASLDALRCGTPGCDCATVGLRCAACGGEAFSASYARATGLVRLRCDDCLDTAFDVRVAGES